ncbi:MAG TPA: hypothetical protein VM261_03935 [Kofleriaceae bacterium]|nr:hypothetical protein [Kofleriaceae bacterium]
MSSRPVAFPLLTALALALTSCGGSGRGTIGGSVASCPTGDVVRYALYTAPSDGGQTYGAPAEAFWRIPVGFRFEDDSPPPYGPITRDTVRALGMLDVPDVVWIYRAGQPACRAQVSGFVAMPEDPGVGISTVVSAVTRDCLPTDDARDAWVLAVAEEPKGCGFAPAGALASLTLDESGGTYALPGSKAPVPAPLDMAVERPACAPSCQTLWSLRSVESSPRVAEMTVTHLVDTSDDEPCNWQATDQFGIYLGGGPGVAPTELLLPPDPAAPDGNDGAGTILPMSLAGAFVDGTGPRIVTLLDVARWGAYSIVPDPARGAALGAGQRLTYYRHHEEDFWFRSLAPYCGP